jgi:hypothetical protein
LERWSSGALPVAVAAGYMSSYGLQTLANKLRNAAALAVHACFMVFPALLPGASCWPGSGATARPHSWPRGSRCSSEAPRSSLLRRIGPLPAAHGRALALLVSRLRPRWLAIGFAAQMALSLALATVNYQHWDGYRRFARQIRAATAGHRVYINGEWGLRYYLEADGGLPLERGQVLRAGDIVVSSQLAYPVEFTAPTAAIAEQAIRASLPCNSSDWKRAPATPPPPKDCGRSTSPPRPSTSCAPRSCSTGIPHSLTCP